MDKLKIFLKSFLSLFAIMRLTEMTTKNPLSIILFLMLIYIYSKFNSNKIESRIVSGDIALSSILSALFTIFTISARYNVILGGLTSTLFCVIILALSAFGFLILFFHVCLWILQACGELMITNNVYTPTALPFITFIVCLVCWIPYFLFEYPGIMTPDSVNQFCQVMGVYELSNHHSVIHTAIIGACYNIGFYLFGNVYAGIAFYTVIQMIFMAFCAGYVVRTLQKAGAITPIIIVSICFYAVIPYNVANVVTILKDTLFAGFMSLFAASLMRLLVRNSDEKMSIAEYVTIVIPYFISAIMVCVLRGNGWYAFLATLPFIVIIFRNNLKLIIPVHVIILLVVLFIKYPLMEIYEIAQPDYAESISIPVQQIARVITNGEQLSDSEYEYVSQIMDIEQVPLVYQADVSDNIKNLIRQTGLEYLENNKSEFFKVWFSIGLKHPKAYFAAYVDQTVGFWYPDVASEVGLSDGIFDNPLGLSWQPVISGSFLVKLKEIVFKLPDLIPMYGLLWSMGFLFWVVLIIAAICIRSGEPENTVILLPFIFLTLTLCIATPVANEFRYAYPVFYALPLLLMTPFLI
jgi:hypothetical protein